MEDAEDEEPELQLVASYGYKTRKKVANRFKLGEGLVGQAALEKQPILVTERAGRLHPRSPRASARRRRATSSSCRSSSRTR